MQLIAKKTSTPTLFKMVKLDPPGTWCQTQALMEMIAKGGGKTFLEVGCGGGDLSHALCERGYEGKGIDFSPAALKIASDRLAGYLRDKRYELIQGDFTSVESMPIKVDIALSMFVMEHIHDDLGFAKKLKSVVKPGGHVFVGVPGRRDRWCVDDETAGHLRRYEREDLKQILEAAGLKNVEVWSASVPVTNLLFNLSNFFVKRAGEERKKSLSQTAQTQSSGIREIPFKTVFPSWCRLLLNRFTMYPLFVLQRLFYRSKLGLTLIAMGTA